MLSVEEALSKILNSINVLGVEEKPVPDCLGQVLAENVYAGIDIPPSDNSSMDGYALRAEDAREASPDLPRILKVIDTVIAGSIPHQKVMRGTAIRIMTGAIIPEGADCVIKFEDTDEGKRDNASGNVAILHEPKPGQYIRKAGEDIAAGSRVLQRGTVLKPAHSGVLASVGMGKVKVFRRPRIAVLATGDELSELGQPLAPGRLFNSNSYSIAAQASFYGGIAQILGIARDHEDSLVNMLRRGLDADMLVTTGGVSMGDYDIVRDVLMKQGSISFWSVRMKPGKPIAFGTFRNEERNIPHLGLPGNPVSAMVTFELFGRPAIMKMMGKTNLSNLTIEAVMEDEIPNEDGRRVFARVTLEKRNNVYFARSSGPQGSGILMSMVIADGLAIVPEDLPKVGPGDKVKVIVPDWNCGEF